MASVTTCTECYEPYTGDACENVACSQSPKYGQRGGTTSTLVEKNAPPRLRTTGFQRYPLRFFRGPRG